MPVPALSFTQLEALKAQLAKVDAALAALEQRLDANKQELHRLTVVYSGHGISVR